MFHVKFIAKFHETSREVSGVFLVLWSFLLHFGDFFSQKPDGAGLVYYKVHFMKILVTYLIYEEMLKSKYYNDSLSDFQKYGTTEM